MEKGRIEQFYYIHTKDYHSSIKKNEVDLHVQKMEQLQKLCKLWFH